MDEATAVEQVVQGLVARFASVDPTTVRAVVDDVHGTFDGPVRDYVPLLVERASRDRLDALVADRAMSSADPVAPTASPAPATHGRWDAVPA